MSLRVAVIGLGVGEQHAATYAAHPRCEVVALCDRSPEQLAEVGRAHPGARRVANAGELLRSPDVDLVSIASFDQDHFAQVAAALEAGKHVFVEKPLCRSRDELRAIKDLWQGHRVGLASNLVLRAAPLFRRLKQEIRDGRLGELYAVDGDYLYGRLHKITEGWRRDVEDYSVMQGGGVHLVDLMLWLTGQRPVTVAAVGSRIVSRDTAFRYDDFRAATFRFESGLVGRITANFGCVHPHQHVLRVFGTAGTFLYDDRGARVFAGRDGAEARTIPDAARPASKGDLIPAFVDAILDGRDLRAETQHELDVIAVCLAADEAATTGRTVDVCYE